LLDSLLQEIIYYDHKMDRKSRTEPSPSEALWFCNLQLLGFQASGSPVNLTRSLFEHSNPTAFHQVFYFLFKQLNLEKTKTEFRDCWPILDKKQEAEFRRKVVNVLKEYQKEFPTDLPYTNPSLFQSPGGRRFTAFLASFSSFVMKMLITKSDDNLLSKPVTKNAKLKKISLSSLAKSEKKALQNAVMFQAEVEKIENTSRTSMEKIAEKYFALKKIECDIEELKTLDELKKSHSEFVVNGVIDKGFVLENYDKKCEKVKELKDNLKYLFEHHTENWDNIITVVDDSLPQKRLNFNQYPKELVAENNLALTFENMITKSLFITGRVLEFILPSLPMQDAASSSSNLGSQLHLLTELQEELGMIVEKMKEHVQGMLKISIKIDWSRCELAPLEHLQKDSQVLLPPTPSMLDTLMPGTTARKMELQLLSPDPDTLAPSQVHNDTPLTSQAPDTPVSTGQVSRRILRRITPDPSPLLRQSLTSSMISRSKDESSNRVQDSTKDSLGVFSPVLSSTKSPNTSTSSQSESATADTADITSSQAHNTTQNKIELYRKILHSVGRQEKSQDQNKSSLLSTWSKHRESLSPRVSPPRKYSPLLSYQTPDKSYQEMDSKLATRLDQLMTSLTFSDNSMDLSLGNMEMGGDLELLSPHC